MTSKKIALPDYGVQLPADQQHLLYGPDLSGLVSNSVLANVTAASSGADILAAYNTLAIINGIKPLAGFKLSKPQLIAKLDALPPAPIAAADVEFSVTKLAAERGVDAKTARAALRKAGFAAPYSDSAKLRDIILAIKPRTA